MSKLKYTLLISLAWLSINGLLAQDPAFTQAYANPLYLNPAFAGTGSTQRIGINVHDYWPEVNGSSILYNFSYDRGIIDSTFGIGLLANSENTGGAILVTNNIDLVFSKQFHIKSVTLSVGVEGGWHERYADQTRMSLGDEIDPMTGFIYGVGEYPRVTTVAVPDFSVGALGYGKNYFVGFAMSHLTQPDESFITGASPLSLKYTINAGYIIPISSYTLTPTILYENQQALTIYVAECYLAKDRFTLGAGYRVGDAILLSLGYKNNWMQIGYSFDYTTSALTISSGGCHEISFAVLLGYHSEKLKKVNCINIPLF